MSYRASRIASPHRAEHTTKFMNVQIQVWKLRLWIICSSTDLQQPHCVRALTQLYLHLSPTQHAAPLPTMNQQRRNEGIPNCKNLSTHLYQASEN